MLIEEIQGTVIEIIFQNDDTGFKICAFDCDGDLITIKGILPFIREGEYLSIKGTWENHKEYGDQFFVKSYEKSMPQSSDDIISFLSSGLIDGVGNVTANLIVENFGKESLNIILNEPYKLEKIKGISHNKAVRISEALEEHKQMSDIVILFNKFGIGINLAAKVYKKYGSQSVDIVQNNPYRLYNEIPGVGFKTADSIALSIGLPTDSYNRICAAIVYTLNEGISNGHIFLPEDVILTNVNHMLLVNKNDVLHCLNILKDDMNIIIKEGKYGNHIYLRYMEQCEQYVADKLKSLSNYHFEVDEKIFNNCIKQFESLSGFSLDMLQSDAIHTAGENGLCVITGGPGTGKTTIIKAVLHLLRLSRLNCLLVAPTGRAAKRMSEACGEEAKTIHRLLGVNYASEDIDENLLFSKNENDPIDADAIIIDETSMVDVLLMYHFLKAIKPSTRIIFVGDKDQLPSVGAGKILRDIIDSDCFKTVTLNEIYRRENESLISINAHRINHGEMPKLNIKDKDCFILKRYNQKDCLQTVVELCSKRLPESYKINPMKDIQVIIPVKAGECGVHNVNNELQKSLNFPDSRKKEKMFHNVLFREGDRVMQIKNDYDIEWHGTNGNLNTGTGVFNGEMGILAHIDLKSNTAIIQFDDDREVIYDWQSMDNVELCYAITVHKSQGSEFDYCIIPVFNGFGRLMTRNLLYTAITRAKKLAVIVGSEECLKHMIDNNSEQLRYSGLMEALKFEN